MPDPTVEGIRLTVIEVVGDDPEVAAAYLFGSRARGRHKAGSPRPARARTSPPAR